jgi:hypothetical protein
LKKRREALVGNVESEAFQAVWESALFADFHTASFSTARVARLNEELLIDDKMKRRIVSATN